jgi:hypothetical protein
MKTWALLAPGPSASAEQAARIREAGIPLGVVGNAFQLASLADFLAATDGMWWRKYPEALEFAGKRYTMHAVRGAERVRVPAVGSVCNSGVLALQCAMNLGATRILLCGFDMHGSHFFGKYENGLSNTTEKKRVLHLSQYAKWARTNPRIEVINCTEGSALKCFPTARLDDCCLHDGIRSDRSAA